MTSARRRLGASISAAATTMVLIATMAGPASATPDSADAIATRAAQSSPLATAGLSETSHSKFVGAGVSDGYVTLTRIGAGRHVGEVGASQAVFAGTNVNTVVQRTATGGRILEEIQNRNAPTTFDYAMTLPAGSEIFSDRGGSDLLIGKKTQDAQGTVTIDVQQVVAPAWAVDANGRSLPAKYTVDGTKIRMSVDTSGAVFPVTADPSYTAGGFEVTWSPFLPIGAVVSLDKARTDDAMDGYIVGCGFLALVPGIGTPVALACAVMGFIAKTSGRIAGFCARYVVSFFDPTHPSVSLYSGGFCA